MSKKVIVIAGSIILLLTLVNFVMLLHINTKIYRTERLTWEQINWLAEYTLEDIKELSEKIEYKLDDMEIQMDEIQLRLLNIEGELIFKK